ncbi:MAG: DUF6088 family protein [Methylacidiphilales bacterium]|nr:DUF6088 family protein [Candidatus Methylacidiphilales bacterium]
MTRTISPLKTEIQNRISRNAPFGVWTPIDFLDLGKRDVVDKTLQRMAQAGQIRRIDRGLYHKPGINKLTGKPTTPDYRAIIDALARRDQTRMLVDGMTAANDLGLTNAIPGQVVIHTDARLKPLKLDKLNIQFKPSAPSKLYWAGRPAMRVVQALHWLRDVLPANRNQIVNRIKAILDNPRSGPAIRADLRAGLPTLPGWMQELLRDLLSSSDKKNPRSKPAQTS